MSYNILTETAFFKVINDLGDKMELEQIQEEYHQFVTQVIDLCHRRQRAKRLCMPWCLQRQSCNIIHCYIQIQDVLLDCISRKPCRSSVR